MVFVLVLGLLVGGSAALLLEQWVRDAMSDDPRPVRVLTPAGTFVASRRRAA